MFLIRVLIIGDTGVGKTSIVLRWDKDQFYEIGATIGVDYKAKIITLDEELVKIQLWDTAGQERFRAISSSFYTKAHGVIVAFDVTQRASFESLSRWLSDIRQGCSPSCKIVICANKCDVNKDSWAISEVEILRFASQMDLPLFQTSAATGGQIPELFAHVAKQIVVDDRDTLIQVSENYSRCVSLDGLGPGRYEPPVPKQVRPCCT